MTTAIKTCFKCLKTKPLSDFYKHKEMADGHLNKCKSCAKADVTKNRHDKIDQYRDYDRLRGNRMPSNHASLYRWKYPERARANQMLSRAVRSGKVKKPSACTWCGSTYHIVGHHTHYDAPLSVVWLCQACHAQIHSDFANKHGEY